tara:strand:- start:453 stop:623 length:171 start_codon:yes stop_codon:yes gene_type:complete
MKVTESVKVNMHMLLKWMTEMDERLIELERGFEALLAQQEMAIKLAEAEGRKEWYG